MAPAVTRSPIIAFVTILALAQVARSYPVGPAVSLDKMTAMADLIVKAKVVSNDKVADDWFKPFPGIACVDTRLQIISTIQGDSGRKDINFRHYALDPAAGSFFNFMPQHYELQPGRSYIIFASKTDHPGVFHQLWLNHTTKEDQGILLAASDAPSAGISVKNIFWDELIALTKSTDPQDVIYSIRQLDEMSRSGWQGVEVFDRKPVAEAIRPLLESKDPKILQAAIEAAGSHNPFMQSQNAPFWLATVGPGHSVGLGTWDRNFDNVAGRVLWRDLVALIDSPVSENLRAAAVRSLGRSSVPELTAALQRWAVDSQPLVRQAAIVLFADVPGESAHQHIASAAADSSPQVRQAAAQAIGFGQIVSLVPLLGDLLKDDAPEVRDAAAMSLLSFPISASGDLLKTNINDPEYRSLFVNALAANQPEPYLADLEDIIAKHQAPSRFWGGRIPEGDSWDILFQYAQSRPADEFSSHKLDAVLNALEKLEWDQQGSSAPRDLYALYLQHGLTDRAKAFRALCEKEIKFDIDYYFNQVDKSLNEH